MSIAREIWNYLLVTLITVLIWAWAAGETRQQVRQIKLEFVPVQLVDTSRQDDGYVVQIEPMQLREAIVSADTDLIRRIQAREVDVVAVLHLSPVEKESQIEFKKISYFMATIRERDGTTRRVQINPRTGDADLPIVNLRIVKPVR